MDCDRGTHNWCGEVKDILTKLNLREYYANKKVVGLDTAKHHISQYHSNTWQHDLPRVSKLRTYTLFKNDFKQEHYLQLNLKKSERSLFAQFRCGILPLRVETGRYVGERQKNGCVDSVTRTVLKPKLTFSYNVHCIETYGQNYSMS